MQGWGGTCLTRRAGSVGSVSVSPPPPQAWREPCAKGLFRAEERQHLPPSSPSSSSCVSSPPSSPSPLQCGVSGSGAPAGSWRGAGDAARRDSTKRLLSPRRGMRGAGAVRGRLLVRGRGGLSSRVTPYPHVPPLLPPHTWREMGAADGAFGLDPSRSGCSPKLA